MAVKPAIKTLTNSSIDILNAIRNSSSTNYQDYVPVATTDAEIIRAIGSVIMDSPNLQNEFLNSLVNRIGLVIVKSKMYSNPWKTFKRGVLEYGEVIEEIFVEIASVHQYDPSVAESQLFKREIPDVRTAFHVMNYQKFYKATIQRTELKKAFLSVNGVTDLITKIIESMYSGAEYDEFIVMKYLLAKHLLNGQINPESIPAVSKANAKDITTTIRGVSDALVFMSDKNNIAKVRNYTPKEEQYIILNTKFNSIMDVEVLSAAFNMDKADFMGHRILIDGFGEMDDERLTMLFTSDPTYVALTADEKAALNEVPAIICDKDWFMIYDQLIEVTDAPNQEGLYWNYWLHLWKTFSVSPFANAKAFVPGTPAITSVTVTPASATIKIGQTLSLSTIVETEYFAPETVTYTSGTPAVATVSASGVIIGLTAGTSTITVKSVFAPLKTDTVAITVIV